MALTLKKILQWPFGGGDKKIAVPGKDVAAEVVPLVPMLAPPPMPALLKLALPEYGLTHQKAVKAVSAPLVSRTSLYLPS